MKKILLIDGNSFFYRSYYASLANLNYYTHNSTSAVYTAIKMLKKFLREQNKYHCVLIAFDLGKNTIRHQQFPAYKSTRKKTPDDLIEQIPLFEEFLKLMKIDFLKNDLYEADDLIGSLCKIALKQNFAVDILSSDHDLLQIIDTNVNLFFLKKGVSQMDVVNSQNFFHKFNLWPSQVVDFKALVGDSSDNLPGVKGIGPKTAVQLLNQFQTLEKLYQNLDNLKPQIKNKLQKFKIDAILTKQMAFIKNDLKLNYSLEAKEYNFNSVVVKQFYLKYGMKSLLKNVQQKHFLY